MKKQGRLAQLMLAANQKTKERDYWLEKLSGELVKGCFPYDYNPGDLRRTEKAEPIFRIIDTRLDRRLSMRLSEIAGGSDHTLHIILAAALTALLNKYTGKQDIIVGTPIYRHDVEREFINTVLPLRCRLDENTTFKDLLFQARQVVSEAVEHQNYPIQLLADRLEMQDSPGSGDEFSLFDTAILLENIHDRKYLRPLNPHMTFSFSFAGNGRETDAPDVAVEYNSLRYRETTVQRIISHLQHLLETVLANADTKISEVEILTEEEKKQLLDTFCNVGAGYPEDKTIHGLFEEQVARTPGNIALVDTAGGQPVSYRELNEKSDGLAHCLREHGVTDNTIVALLLPRTPDMMAAVMAVLKAGGAYLPIDPGYPDERIDYMLIDSGAKVAVTTGTLVEEGSRVGRWEGEKILLEENLSMERPLHAPHPVKYGDSSNPAYVIYTSGTTGKSKGVLIEHKNVVRLLFNDRFQFDFNDRDVWTLFHSYSFDFSVWEMFGALLYGGQLIVVPHEIALDPAQFLETVKKHRVTVLNQTPSAFYNVIHEELKKESNHLKLRYVIFGGEALKPGKLGEWQKRYPHTRLVNMFGITETTVHVTYKEIGKEEIAAESSNIGGPIPTLGIYVMDRFQRLMPVGTAGELCVGGAGVGRGYLNRPELTAERFVKNPYNPGEWLYKSGDLARVMENGDMEYLGRIDHQVQIHGFRIELGEIESQLLRDGDVDDVVVLTTGEENEISLCAYVVPTSPETFDVPNLREHLAHRLPGYMIPSYFVKLAKIPLTPNGKVDRKALPEPGVILDRYIAPRNPVERRLTELWSRALKLEKVGVKDNYFNIGGDSIKAIRLVSLINSELNTSISIVDLYAFGTIETLAEKIALLSGDTGPGDDTGTFVPPSTPEENLIAEIWREILEREKIGIHDNFFQLGGDPNRSIQVVSRFRERGLYITSRDLFLYPTITELLENIEKIDLNAAGADAANEFSHRLSFNLISREDRAKIPGGIDDAYPLTMLQAGLVFHSELSPDTALYHDIVSYKLQGRFDRRAFEGAVECLVKRHNILRTTYDLHNFSQYLQLVHKEVPLPLRVEDLRGTPKERQEEILAEFVETEKSWRFDWSQPGLLRFIIHVLSDKTFHYTHTMHDSMLDGWSVSLMNTELFQTYSALSNGRKSPLDPFLNVAYRDYVALELESLKREEHKAYWQELLADSTFTELPRWPSKHSREDAIEVCYYAVDIPPELSNALNETAHLLSLPLKNVLLAAHARVLSVFSGNIDVLTGIEHNGRPEIIDGEKILGLFLNTLPFRIKLTGGTWEDLCRAAFDVEMSFLPHRNFPMALMKQEQGGRQLFEAVFNYTNFHVMKELEQVNDIRVLGSNGVLETEFPFRTEFAKSPFSDDIVLQLHYNRHVFCIEQIRAMGNYFTRVLQAMSSDFTGRYELHPVLDEAAQGEFLARMNDTRAEYPEHQCFQSLFEAQTARTPHAPAVLHDGKHWTYKELNREANRLAKVLLKRGVRKESIVTVVMERSYELLAAILAVFKAGAVYLPQEPHYPVERISNILEQSNCYFLLTSGALLPALSGLANTRREVVPLESLLRNDEDGADLCLDCSPGDLAYVIYTSGSTGLPKGAMIELRGMVNHLYAKLSDLCITGDDIIAQNASQCFDISIWQFLAALLVGGLTAVYPDEVIMEPALFMDRVTEDRITILEVVPSYLSVMLNTLDVNPRDFKSLKSLVVTGEELKPELVTQWFARYPGIRMVNAYGPTEASDDITHLILDKTPGMERIPIGKPVQNLNIYVVDNHMQLCPVCVKGEIWVSGVGVGRGYLNDDPRTKEVFMEDPFAGDAGNIGVRLYKTGDIGCWLPDGNIGFFGRKDNQVKIRGFRIELGEIENRLSKYPGIKEAVVSAREDKDGTAYLCAYVTAGPDPSSPVEFPGLIKYLSGLLPEYMIPVHFVKLEKMPLTPNGKVDRKSLPAPGIVVEEESIKPRDEMERKMAEIWAQILGIDTSHAPVGIDDNFFERGGHSLRAMALVSSIHKELDIKIPLAEMFKTSTVRGLAEFAKKLAKDKYTAIEPTEEKEYYPLSPAQKRMYIEHQMQVENKNYNISRVIMLEGEVDYERLEKTFRQLINRHENLRTSFVMVKGESVQIIHDEVAFNIEYYESEEENAQMIIENFLISFDLSRAPLLRVGLIKLEKSKQVLMVGMHHIISDDISHDIMVREITELYNGGEPPPLILQYKDFSEWQYRLLEAGLIKQQEEYWFDRFNDNVPVLDLPTDYPRPSAGSSTEGASIRSPIAGETTARLYELMKNTEVTLYMFLLAVYNILLSRFTGQTDIIVVSPITERRHYDLGNIIGMFVNMVAMRNRPEREKSFKEFLGEVKTNSLDAFENQDYQFTELVRKLNLQGQESGNALLNTVFTMQNIDTVKTDPTHSTPVDALRIVPYKYDRKISVFDLHLIATAVNERINITFEYSTALYRESTVRDILEHYLDIIGKVIHNPDIKLKDIAVTPDLFKIKQKVIVDDQDFGF